MHFYSKEEIEYLNNISYGRTNKQITELFNKRFNLELGKKAISAVRKRHGIKTGENGRFPKGNIPHNKGKKGLGGWEPTQFKKGHKPHNYNPIGTERVNGDGYVDIKIADPNKWKGKHILLWEEHNGPLPKGHVVIFADRNNRNFEPNNLVLVSRQQLLMLNRHKLIQDSADLTRTGILIADLMSKTNQRKRGKYGKNK